MLANEQQAAAAFLNRVIIRLRGRAAPTSRVLDFGCGAGELVTCLQEMGYQSWGCDIGRFWEHNPDASADRLALIESAPYRIPFADGSFDVVLSTSVLEHAQNKEQLFREIHRVLAPGGLTVHLYPSRWYLPIEPHIYVPLVNVFWPNCPRWWLQVWAMAGVRNEFQQGLRWQEVVERNAEYCRTGLSYWSHARYRALLTTLFGNYRDATDLFIEDGYGGVVSLMRRLRAPAPVAKWVCSTFRMSLLVSWKSR